MRVAIAKVMTKTPDTRSIPEEMGLQVQDIETLRPIDFFLVVAVLASGAAWLWVSIAAPGLELPDVLKSVFGRSMAALIGGASVVAVLRSLLVSRWPLSERDESLL